MSTCLPQEAGLGIARAALVALVLFVLAAAPALAQTGAEHVYRLGVLALTDLSLQRTRSMTLPELDKRGFAEGRNLVVDAYAGSPEELPRMTRALLAGRPDAVVVIGNEPLRAVRAATSTVPIVSLGADAVADGFATSLAHPGGNVTGIVILAPELEAKRLQLLHEAVPAARRVAALLSSSRVQATDREMRAVATSAGLELLVFDAKAPGGYKATFAAMRASGVQALFLGSHPEIARDADKLAALAIDARLPTICQWAEMARAGCLLGYGPNLGEMYRLSAEYLVRIFQGTPPGELPIEQPAVFEFVINLETARRIGIEIPQSLFARADEVIE
jgi:putative ABC transport system substrate-binding protein